MRYASAAPTIPYSGSKMKSDTAFNTAILNEEIVINLSLFNPKRREDRGPNRARTKLVRARITNTVDDFSAKSTLNQN